MSGCEVVGREVCLARGLLYWAVLLMIQHCDWWMKLHQHQKLRLKQWLREVHCYSKTGCSLESASGQNCGEVRLEAEN